MNHADTYRVRAHAPVDFVLSTFRLIRPENVFVAARLSLENSLAACRHFSRFASLTISKKPARQGSLRGGMDSALQRVQPWHGPPIHLTRMPRALDAGPKTHVSRSSVPIRNRPGHRPEDMMFVYLFLLLTKLLDRAEHSRRDAYLASAADIGELERRMRSME